MYLLGFCNILISFRKIFGTNSFDGTCIKTETNYFNCGFSKDIPCVIVAIPRISDFIRYYIRFALIILLWIWSLMKRFSASFELRFAGFIAISLQNVELSWWNVVKKYGRLLKFKFLGTIKSDSPQLSSLNSFISLSILYDFSSS